MISLQEYLDRSLRQECSSFSRNIHDDIDCWRDSFGEPTNNQVIEFMNGKCMSTILTEHLKNIDPKYITQDIKKYFNHIIYQEGVEVKGQLIRCYSNKDLLNKRDKDFDKLCELYQYWLKECKYDRNVGAYDLLLEPNYPKEVYQRYVFHICDKNNLNSILKNGLRPKYVPNEKDTTIWKKYKNDSKNEQYSKVYFFYGSLDNKLKEVKERANDIVNSLKKKKEKCALLMISIDRNIPLYEDKTMPNDYSCFTYYKISPQYIKEIKKW